MKRHHGFTLIEILMVLAVITILAGISFPTFVMVKKQAARKQTAALIESVTLAAESYQQRWWTWRDPLTREDRTVRMWRWKSDDTNPDTKDTLDGRPTADYPSDPIAASLEASGYVGFRDLTNVTISKNKVDSQGHILDSWGKPLRISFAADIYGVRGYAVWSLGPDQATGGAASTDDLVGRLK
jgi:prepilin-type N-terminal cleavage/methylation domain-containing protein